MTPAMAPAYGVAMRSLAAVLHEPGAALSLEEVELDEPRDEEIVVRMAGTGICHTDLIAAGGALGLPLPVVLGHEGAGVVERAGPGVTELAPGDHVVLSFDRCGGCPTCRAGRPAYCERFYALNSSGTRADGTTTMRRDGTRVHGSFLGQSSFATDALASTRNAVRVTGAHELPLELLGPLGCSLQTGAGAVLEVLRPDAGASIAIFGLGSVGLAGVMAAAAAGCDPIVAVEPDPACRALALELGATDALDPDARLARASVDLSLETVGTEAVVDAALRVLRSPGTCATVGFRGPRNPVRIDQGHLLYGRSLVGVIEGDVDPHHFIPRLLALQRDGRFPFERLITSFPFADIADAIDAARSGAAIKPVLTFG
jgi:aryl-alcohol dehydrogenase